MNYIHLFENLSEDRIRGCDAYVSPDIHFIDPFNDIRGIEAFKKLLHKTLEDVRDPVFQVTRRIKDEDILYLKWEFSGSVRVIGHWSVTGLSEIEFDDQGRVCRHVDYWDASTHFYNRLPVIGSLIRLIRRRLQIS